MRTRCCAAGNTLDTAARDSALTFGHCPLQGYIGEPLQVLREMSKMNRGTPDYLRNKARNWKFILRSVIHCDSREKNETEDGNLEKTMVTL